MNKTLKMAENRRFFVSSILFICFLCVLASINELRFDALTRFGHCAFQKDHVLAPIHVEDDAVRILIGVLTLPDHYHKRHFLRMVYGTQRLPSGFTVDVKFVFCNLTKEDQHTLVALEILRYDDVIILNCKENMNSGKTYTYFSSLPEIFSDPARPDPPYHYVVKTDDDTYFRLESLAESLRPLPREDLYYGYVIPCPSMDPFYKYMSGMGYLVSWDIVKWIRSSEIPRSNLAGPEDRVFGDWMRAGRKGKHRFNAKWSMYNYPEPHTGCTHELWPDTVAVHLLKNQEKWIQTLNYFNATKDLKPSKLYHIP